MPFVSEIIREMLAEHMRQAARRDEETLLAGAIALAAEDGERGVSSPRQLTLCRFLSDPLAPSAAALRD